MSYGNMGSMLDRPGGVSVMGSLAQVLEMKRVRNSTYLSAVYTN